LSYFLKSWAKYKKFKFIPLVRPNNIPWRARGWDQGDLDHVLCRRRNGLHDQPSQNKENVPPSSKHEPTRKHKKVNRCNPLIIRCKWTSEALEETMDVIENGTISLRNASRH
jgi:hypothetical protein